MLCGYTKQLNIKVLAHQLVGKHIVAMGVLHREAATKYPVVNAVISLLLSLT